MNKLNFIKADKPDCSNATDSGKITVTVREFITTTLAEKIATALRRFIRYTAVQRQTYIKKIT